jgi:hypothetical protein
VLFSQVPWATRLIGLLVCPVAGGVISVVHHFAGPSTVADFAGGYAFGLVACLLLGGWLHFARG